MSGVTPCEPVPHNYIGLWKRRCLIDAEGNVDRDTSVYWLQTHRMYADLRVPPGRPDFGGITALAECSDAQLAWLGRQQGFAGCLYVDATVCRWEREIDLQPPAPVPDVGRMMFDGDTLIERGVHARYEEEWERLTDGRIATALFLLHESTRWAVSVPRKGFLLVVDDYFMFVRDRLSRPPSALVETHPDRARLLERLGAEISFGVRRGGTVPWEIRLSSLPFREGASLFVPGEEPVRQGDGTLLHACVTGDGAVVCRWGVSEWSAGFSWFD
jgi:hypothetical protein